ncbi:N-acetylmuramoyl-L-alanine amidase AmiA [Phycisphaerae bacterium RAS1]|nr:N-acetylmuramoyl-L-alanine amidase AmiA [Phycisphaerae bacterium RAS1]
MTGAPTTDPQGTDAATRLPPRRNPYTVAVSHAVAAAFGAVLASVWLAPVRTATLPTPAPGPDPLRAEPAEFTWEQHPEAAFPLPPYAAFLRDATIVIDPGHGGREDRPNWKRGPTGLREEVVNLSVALHLRDFLRAAGANVIMTRERDVYLDKADAVDLKMRAEIANRARADLLLSIHHNSAERAEANYTSVFYHGDPDDSPASVCAARHILAGLNDALRLSQHIECAALSDTVIYPKVGFAVLREAQVPAVLAESSFHSNPDEEARLRDPIYNRREAYGLFIGLARWAQAGLPRVKLLGAERRRDNQTDVVIELDDGLSKRGGMAARSRKIIEQSISVRWGGAALPFSVDWEKRQLRMTLPAGAASKTLRVDFENVFGQHVLHPLMELRGLSEPRP